MMLVSRQAELQAAAAATSPHAGSRSCWVRVFQTGSLSPSLSSMHRGFPVCSDSSKPSESKDPKVG